MHYRCRAAGDNLARGMALVVICALLCACAVNPPFEIADHCATTTTVVTVSVPFFPQPEHQCGPAALAGVLGAAGVAIAPEVLTPQVYLPGRQGSLQIELLAATRRGGRIAYRLAEEPQALIAELEAGRPVLVLQNLLTPHVPVWHYAVLTGFDARSNRFFLNSGTKQQLPIDAGKFLRSWDWADRWAMVALRPGEIPARADPHRYAEAVTAFEIVASSEATRTAWQAAAERWPQEPLAYLALGNLAYGAADLQHAIDFYRRGLKANPRNPALLNNLASVLGEVGCPRTAELLLLPFASTLSADSKWKAEIDTTLAELAAHTGGDAANCTPAPSESQDQDFRVRSAAQVRPHGWVGGGRSKAA